MNSNTTELEFCTMMDIMNKVNRHNKMGEVICIIYNQHGINMQNIQGTWENQFEKERFNPDRKKKKGKEL